MPVQGIGKGKRTTERFRRSLLWACDKFSDLTEVRKAYACSTWAIYQTLYEHLEINLKRHINYPWPKAIGIDEHFFSRAKGYRECLFGFYRIHGHDNAAKVLTRITDSMAHPLLPEIKTLRRTLMKWRNEILNYFKNRITNARTEGFNNVAKVVQRRAYGVKSFKMYRLRYLSACA